jgi:AAA15 family ATPase/GTPase
MAQLLSIKIKNYRSFYTEQELRFGDDKARNVTALFGPNSGGKSNTARAMIALFNYIYNSANANVVIPYEPFLLKEGAENEATGFEIVFESHKRYFTYLVEFNHERVMMEGLFEKSEKINRQKLIFMRNENGIVNAGASKFGFGLKLVNKTRKETLLITKAREDNNRYSNIVFELLEYVSVIPGGIFDFYGLAIDILKKNPVLKDKTIQLLRNCDFSIQDFVIEDVSVSEEMLQGLPLSEEIKKDILQSGDTRIRTSHVIRNSNRKVVGSRQFDLNGQESIGTKKFFEMAVLIVDALEQGKTLYIDEFGAYLHPTLADEIIKSFKSADNKSGAKLILNTHNTSIMASLDREDIVLVEKNMDEESIITPLANKPVRVGESFEKRYRQGLYGGAPIMRERYQ